MRVLGLAAAAAAVAALLAGCGTKDGESATTTPSSAAPSVAQLKDCGGKPVMRPASITVTCADANLSVTDITWLSWTDRDARGTGIEHRNNCQPDCAAGQQESMQVTIELSGPVNGVFAQITLAGSGAPESYPLPS
ncbi:hypothetical protein [Nocardia sp. NPDC052566]|uniref:hypothetical protein n=1 Tax=Nocardia sp. NPDC052566 TaxID=3364330 RepID=UPI0037C5D036